MRLSIVAALAAASFCLAGHGPAAAQWQPNRPVEFIVASGPGGGTDQFARLVQSIIQKHELMRVPVVVSNKGGGAGSEAFVYAKGAAGDATKVVFGTNNEWLLPLVTKVGYQSSDLRPVAAMAVDEFILWTNTETPYKTAAEFIAAARTQEGGLKVAGSQSKDTDQILVRRLEEGGGVKFTYVPFKSGGEAAVQLAGAHVQANTNNPQENVGQWKAGKVRPLCVFAPQRLSYKEIVADNMSWRISRPASRPASRSKATRCRARCGCPRTRPTNRSPTMSACSTRSARPPNGRNGSPALAERAFVTARR